VTVDKQETSNQEPLTTNQLNQEQGDAFEFQILPTFEDFWKAYGYSKNKIKCVEVWEKISQPDREKIMVHVPEYVKSTPDKQFRKHPLTYLRQQSWNDEIIQSNDTGSTKTGKSNRLENALADLNRIHGEG
jgi:hypothetical protein